MPAITTRTQATIPRPRPDAFAAALGSGVGTATSVADSPELAGVGSEVVTFLRSFVVARRLVGFYGRLQPTMLS